MSYYAAASAHEPCQVRIFDYLEGKGKFADKGNRALSHDFINIDLPKHQDNWGHYMDKIRAASGNDTNWGSKNAVMYRHFIISPNPEDNIDLDTLRELSIAWASHFFGDPNTEDGAGELGCYQVALIAHDDNEHNIPHMHIIVNNTDLNTGKRLQITPKYTQDLMPNKLQELAKDRGLSFFDNVNPDQNQEHKLRRYYTKAERNLLREGKFSWKEEIRNTIEIARRTSTNEKEFIDEIKALGLNIKVKGDDWVFQHHSGNERWKVAGYRLGQGFTRSAILAQLENDKLNYYPRHETLRQNITSAAMLDFYKDMDVVAITNHAMSIKNIAKTCRVIDEMNIRSMGDFESAIEIKKSQLPTYKGTAIEKELRKEIALLINASKTCEDGGFFKGVHLPKVKSHSDYVSDALRAAEAEAAKNAGRKRKTARHREEESRSESISRRSERSRGRK